MSSIKDKIEFIVDYYEFECGRYTMNREQLMNKRKQMLDAYLTESDEFPELLRYCNIAYEVLPYEVSVTVKDPKISKPVRKLSAIAMVAAGYGGDMPEELACGLLDDMDFSFNKISCPKIERMLPQFNKMVERELNDF